jgi:hypothetical protein
MESTAKFRCSASQDQIAFELNLKCKELLNEAPTPLYTGNGFADVMLHDLLTKDIARGTPEFDTLLKALHCAITTYDKHATRLIWRKILKVCDTKWDWYERWDEFPDLGDPTQPLKRMALNPEVLRFLVCYAHLPQLVIALHQKLPSDTPSVLRKVSSPGEMMNGPYPHSGDEKQSVVALLATVLRAVTALEKDPWLVDDSGERTRLHLGPAWHTLIRVLIKGMPRNPHGLVELSPALHTSVVNGQPTNILTVVLECSETTLGWLEALLANCKFAYHAENHAIERLLRIKTLNEDLVVPAVQMLYAQLLKTPRPPYRERALQAIKGVWINVAELSTAVSYLPVVNVGESGEVAMLCVPNHPATQAGLKDPGLFVEMFTRMAHMHTMTDFLTETRVPELACAALHRLMPQGGSRVVLVQALINLVLEVCARERVLGVYDSNGISFLAQHVPHFVSLLLRSFPSIFETFCPEEFSYEIRKLEQGEKLLQDALMQCIEYGHREGVRHMLNLLKGVPRGKNNGESYLIRYVRGGLCKDLPVQERGWFSPELVTAHYKEIKQDFEHFLSLGAPWDEEELRVALRAASIRQCTIAVQVLVSPPYNVPMPSGEANHLVEHVLGHVLAPGAPLVREAEARFVEKATAL